jgi:outer membrane protein, multidrug efflux system
MRNHVHYALSLSLVVVLGGCTPSTVSATLAGADLPFIAPNEVGSWVAITPEQLAFVPRTASGTVIDDLGFVGLRGYIETMLQQNPTLQQAKGRLTQAQAIAGASLSALLPSLSANASVSRGRSSPGPSNQGTRNLPTENNRAVGVSTAWPFDIFGRFTGQLKTAKRLRESADAEVQATALALKAALAQTYVQLLAAHTNTATWRDLMAAAEEQNRLTQLRYAAGDLPLTSTEPIFATLQSLRVQAINAAQTEQQLHHTLAALLGQGPQTFTLPAADLKRVRMAAIAAPTSASSTLLLQRPDVRAAAAQFAAANANIGVARAAFLPSITLGGNAGYAAGQNGNLFDWNNRTWSVGPMVTLPLFQGGANRANLKRAWGQYEQAVGIYRAEVLGAYQDTANAFTGLNAAQNQAHSASAAAAAMTKAADAMEQRYALGDVSKAEFLNTRIMALQAEAMATSAAAAHHAAVIELARSLGGGW